MWEQVKGMLALPQDESQRAAAKQGLLAAGAAMMNGRGNFVGMLGEGLGTGMQGYHGALAQQQQTALRQAQMQQVGLENQQREAEMARPGRIAGALAGVGTPPGIQPISSLPRLGQSAGEGTQSVSRTLPPAASPEYLVNYYRQRGDALMNVDVDAAKIQYDLAEKQRAKLMKRETLIRNGKPVSVLTYEDGREMDSTYDALPDNQVVDMGGSQVIIDRNLPQAGTQFAKSASPDARLSAQTARRGQDVAAISAARSSAKAPPGYRWSADGQSLEPIPGGPVTAKTTESQQKIVDAKSVLDLVNIADPLIPKATSSYGGAAMDQVARVFGSSTDGSEVAAQLQALEGALVAKMPKMSGPQSDKDVLLYKQMAGRIGDPTIPAASKQAAADVIWKLNQKYLEDAGVKPVLRLKDLPKLHPGAPAKGTTKGGYRFKGGDPAIQSNWEKV